MNNKYGIFLIKILLPLILGAILTLAYHPFDLIIAAPISFTGFLLYLDHQKSLKQKFISGIIYGYGHFLTSLYWIVHALFTDMLNFAWMIPLVLIFIPLVMALFIGGMVVVAEYFRFNKIAYVLGFSVLWVLFEFMRSFSIFPFPWNLLGYTSLASDEISQFASVVGVYGMSFLVCVLSTSFYSRNKYYIAIILIIGLVIYIFGYIRLKNAELEYVEGFNLRLVQPNLTQHHMGDAQKQESDLLTLIKLSLQGLHNNTITIWPEATFPYILSNDSRMIPFLAEIISQNGFLITGTDWIEWDNSSNQWDAYNSIIAINKKAEVISLYHKTILVPFGEYIPLRDWFPDFIKRVAYGISDFKNGKSYTVTTLIDPLPPIVNLICSEAIFTHLPYMYRSQSFGLLLNLTNDTWFGNSIGPYQHYNMARMRAIEYNTPLVRVAKHGISAIFDQYGRVIASLRLGEQGVIDSKIPKKTLRTSFYLLYYPHVMMFLFVLGFLLLILKKLSKQQ